MTDCLKCLKTINKFIEKEVNNVIGVIMKLKDNNSGFEDLSVKIDKLEKKIIKLKNQYLALIQNEEKLFDNLETRIDHLKHVEQNYDNISVQTEYFEKRLWRL